MTKSSTGNRRHGRHWHRHLNHLAQAGYKVVTTYTTAGKRRLAGQDERGLATISPPCNAMTDLNPAPQLSPGFIREIGPISVLVNNAGITRDGACRKWTRPRGMR